MVHGPPHPELLAHGWSERVAALAADAVAHHKLDGSCEVARVTRIDRDRAHVVTAGGHRTASAPALPAVGDWVLVEPLGEHDPPLAVRAVLPRWSSLVRKAAGRGALEQVLAADVDVVAIVMGLDRPNPSRLDRELVLAWESGATPVVVLCKADAFPEGRIDEVVDDVAHHALGVDVIVSSAVDGRGIADLAVRLRPDRTLVLFGASGAGKSSLANALLHEDHQDTGRVRMVDGRGRHTTVTRDLVPVPGGGVLLDTPGLREVGLWDATEGLAQTFADVEALAARCRFADCGHQSEPGCSVKAAIRDGSLAPERLTAWLKLQRELDAIRRRADARAQADYHRALQRQARSRRADQRGPRP